MAQRSIHLLLIGLLAGALAACGGSGTPRGAPPPVVPSTGPAGTTATCPTGSDPDAPGPARQSRPRFPELGVSAAFDRQSGRVVLIDVEGGTWTFNVCANTWEYVVTKGAASLGRVHLFYDAVDDLTYSVDVGNGFPSVRTFSVETATWTRLLQPSDLWMSPWDGLEPRFVMDPTERVIYGYQPSTGQMRAYDIATNTWAEVEQREPGPPTGVDALASFDPTAGRIVLYIGYKEQQPADEATGQLPDPTAGPLYAQTWTFDPGTSTWERVSDNAPVLVFGYVMAGTEMAYNEASRSSVVFADGALATFEATSGDWILLDGGPGWPPSTSTGDGGAIYRRPDGTENTIPLTTGPLARHGHGLVDDVVNGRVLVLGGSVRTAGAGWQDGTDVWAYTVATNTWTELVPVQPD